MCPLLSSPISNALMCPLNLSFDNLPWPIPCGSAGKESTCNVGDLGSIPGLGRSLEKGKATHFSFGLENFRYCTVHEVAKSNMTEWPHGPSLLLSLDPSHLMCVPFTSTSHCSIMVKVMLMYLVLTTVLPKLMCILIIQESHSGSDFDSVGLR